LAHQHSLPKEAYTGEDRLEQHDVVIAAEPRVAPSPRSRHSCGYCWAS
jgi:hypothetical protein